MAKGNSSAGGGSVTCSAEQTGKSTARSSGSSIWLSGPAARLLTRACGMWRVPHGIGVPGQIAFMPYRVIARPSVMGGYDAQATGSAS